MQLTLAHSRPLRFAAFAVLYLAQGIPIGLFTVALPAWLASLGAEAADVGTLVAVTGLPWAFKLVSGPFMDRFAFPAMGRRRPWVIAAQLGLVCALGALLLVDDPIEDLWTLIVVGIVINAFAAVQDVAVDGMAIDILEADERGRANALMAFGQVVGFSGFGALAAYLLSAGGLTLTGLVGALIVAAIATMSCLLRERPGERLLPWTTGVATAGGPLAGSFRDIFTDLLKALLLPMSLVLIAVELISRIAAGIYVTFMPVLAVQELGFSPEAYSNTFGITGAGAAVIGILFGPAIDRFGAKRLLMLAFLIAAGLAIGFALLRPLWAELSLVVGVFALAQLASQAFFIAMIAMFMGICWTKVSATQFAIYMSLANLSRSAGAALYGYLAADLGATGMLYLMGGLLLLGALCLAAFDGKRQADDLARLAETDDERLAA